MPRVGIVQPPPGAKDLDKTYIDEAAVGELARPLVLDFHNLITLLVGVDVDHAVDGLLDTHTLDRVARAELHADRVTGADDLVTETLDLREDGLEAVLCRVVRLQLERKGKSQRIPIEARTACDLRQW